MNANACSATLPGVYLLPCAPTDTVCLGLPRREPAARHRIIRVTSAWCPAKQRGATPMGPVYREAYVCRSCACNVLNALSERHGVEPPRFTGSWAAGLNYVDYLVDRKVWHFEADGYGWDWWFNRWSLSKRIAIKTSMVYDLVVAGYLNAMIKREVSHAFPKKARLIQYYRNMATQALWGPMFVAVQKGVFRATEDYEFAGCRITYGSGLAPGGLAAWMERVHERFPTPWFYERDGKNWDATMQEQHHLLKMRLYEAVDKDFAAFVDAGFDAVGHVGFPDGVIQYRLHGTVKSGHNDTTLGNSLINACIALEACARLGLRAEILVVGDDLLIATESDPSAVVDVERTFGIVPEARVFRDYIDVSFISGCWLRASGGFLFVPKLGRLLARLWWTCSPPGARKADVYRAAIVAGLVANIGDVPLYAAFLKPQSRPVDYSLGRDYGYWVASFGGNAADASTTRDLMRKYHFLPSEIDALSAEFASLPRGPAFVVSDLAERVMQVDLADLLDRPLAI